MIIVTPYAAINAHAAAMYPLSVHPKYTFAESTEPAIRACRRYIKASAILSFAKHPIAMTVWSKRHA